MGYLWLKSLHIAAVVTWTGGMLLAAVMLAAFSGPVLGTPVGSVALEAVRRWDRRVTSPAMLLAWGIGLTLALQGGWFAAPWLMLKLPLVLLLSALHGFLSGALRRMARREQPSASPTLRYAPAAILAGVLVIAVLVVVKPF